tara:strand:- start:61 stop:498 length:438 start_codon:yes stop_codon:yes gene_type:complete
MVGWVEPEGQTILWLVVVAVAIAVASVIWALLLPREENRKQLVVWVTVSLLGVYSLMWFWISAVMNNNWENAKDRFLEWFDRYYTTVTLTEPQQVQLFETGGVVDETNHTVYVLLPAEEQPSVEMFLYKIDASNPYQYEIVEQQR